MVYDLVEYCGTKMYTYQFCRNVLLFVFPVNYFMSGVCQLMKKSYEKKKPDIKKTKYKSFNLFNLRAARIFDIIYPIRISLLETHVI